MEALLKLIGILAALITVIGWAGPFIIERTTAGWLWIRSRWSGAIRRGRKRYEATRRKMESNQSAVVNRIIVNATQFDLRVPVPDGEALVRPFNVFQDDIMSHAHQHGTVAGVDIVYRSKAIFGGRDAIDRGVARLINHCESEVKCEPVVVMAPWIHDLLDANDPTHMRLLQRAGVPQFDEQGRLRLIWFGRPRGQDRTWKTDQEREKEEPGDRMNAKTSCGPVR